MAYELPKEVAEFEAGGDGYDLNDLFTNIVRGTTLTYDDIIFMPGKLFFWFGAMMCLFMIDFRNESLWCHFFYYWAHVYFLF